MTEVQWVDSQGELEAIVADNDVVVVDYTAPSWCNPCRQFAPHFDAAAGKSEAVFVAVDIDEAPWATKEYGIMSVPTVHLYSYGDYRTSLNQRTAPRLLKEIEDALS